jgi:hypothetical protein
MMMGKQSMTRTERWPKTKEELERLLLAEMQTFGNCGLAVSVIVVPFVGHHVDDVTWTVSCFNPGESSARDCEQALQVIVPRFQFVCDLVQKH